MAGAMGMEIHEVCRLFPMMGLDGLKALAEDIRAHGLIEPIWTHEGKIIDGRHRHAICLELGITPRFVEWSGQCGSIVDFVVSQNLHRRHLDATQRACAAVEAKLLRTDEIRRQAEPKKSDSGKLGGRGRIKRVVNNGKSLSGTRDARKEVAESFGVSNGYVASAEQIQQRSPETFEAMKAGRIKMPAARKKVGLASDGKSRHEAEGGGTKGPAVHLWDELLQDTGIIASGIQRHGIEQICRRWSLDQLRNGAEVAVEIIGIMEAIRDTFGRLIDERGG